MNDDLLLTRLRRGCRRSLAMLIERHQGPLRAFAAAVAPRPDLADDIAQETLLRAVDRLDDYAGPDRFGPWLRGIARNVAREHWRALVRQPTATDLALEELLADDGEAVAGGDADDLAALRRCLDGLGGEARKLVDLRFRLGQSSREIAELTDRKPSSVRAGLSRIYSHLRRCMGAPVAAT